MLRQHQASLDDRKKFTALVKDLFPDQAKNVNLLLMAYNMGIAQDIQSASHINNTFAFRYVKQLMDDFGMSRVNADWIVSVHGRSGSYAFAFIYWFIPGSKHREYDDPDYKDTSADERRNVCTLRETC